MRNIKTIALFLALSLALTLTVVAATTKKTINIELSGIKINVDGSKIDVKDGAGKTVEPFLYNGTVYIPIQVAGKASGKEVTWDPKTSTVNIGKKPAAAVAYSRTNPAPINTLQTISVDDYTDKYSANIKVVELLDGDAAWQLISKANMFNTEPESGKKYILAKVAISISNVKGDKAVSLSGYMFDCFSADNKQYEQEMVIVPDPKFEGDIYSGSSLTGYVAFYVNSTDKAPKMVFGRKYDGTGGIWFKLTK